MPWHEWQQLREELEEDIRAYDGAKLQSSDPIPFGQAVREIRKAAGR